MKRPLLLAVILPVVLLLAACGDDGADTSQSPAPTGTRTSAISDTPTPQATVPPVVQGEVNPDDYLLEGGIGVLDADGFWMAHYGFYFEPTKSARCDIFIFSGDDPVVSCGVLTGKESMVTYALPADAQCDNTTANPFDGYTMALGAKGLAPQRAGFSGCQDGTIVDPPMAAATKVLGEGQQLTTPPFSCVVNGKAVGCGYVDGSDGSFIYGLFTAVHAG